MRKTDYTPAAIDKQEAKACPECGGSLTTWKCLCDPIWPGYAATLDKEASQPADNCKPGGCSAIGCDGGHYCFNKDGTPKPVAPSVEQDERARDERAAFESWASRYTKFPENYDNIPAWLAWQACAASTSVNVANDDERVYHEQVGVPAAPMIVDPVSRIDGLLIVAKAAPRFRDDTYDAIDRLDAAMFTGDEFFGDSAIRQHFRYYLARWEKKLREFDEFDEFDSAMDGEKG